MGSKGRVPPHLRWPVPGLDMMHPDPFAAPIRPPPGPFPFDMPPPPEILEQKLVVQHIEMERLAMENQRLASTHSALRQDLAVAQHEAQRLKSHMAVVEGEQDQQLRFVLDKIAKMESELHGSEALKLELQQARSEAQNLVTVRQDLIFKVQQLNQDMQRNQIDAQQLSQLMSELEALKQEYQHCRTTYEYERKIFSDHYESLQVMEKNYVTMVREVEKLRAELANSANPAKRSAGTIGNVGDEPAHHSKGHQIAYEDAYGASQLKPEGAVAPYSGVPVAPSSTRSGYDAPRAQAYEGLRTAGYEDTRGGHVSYDAASHTGYEMPRSSGYDPQRVAGAGGYGTPRGPGVMAGQGMGGVPVNAAAPYGSLQAQNPYVVVEQAPRPYGLPQAPAGGGLGPAPAAAGGGYGPP